MLDLTTDEKRLIYLLSGDLDNSPKPYAELAEKLGWSEAQILEAIGRFKDLGLIRRLGATLWHQRSGFAANSMVVFKVADDQAAELGAKLAERPYVSHCYLRKTVPGWPFNLYAMAHAESNEALARMVREMAELVGAEQWRRLDSLKELKKASLRYFIDQGFCE